MNNTADGFLMSVLARAGRGMERISLDSIVADLMLTADSTILHVLHDCVPGGVPVKELEPVRAYLARSVDHEPISNPVSKADLEVLGLMVAYGVMQLGYPSEKSAVLMICALGMLAREADQARWRPLELKRVLAGLQGHLGIPAEGRSTEATTSAAEPKEELPLSVADLWLQAEGMPPFDQSPLADDPIYLAVFEQIARVIYRRKTGHVALVAEKGVGVGAVLVDFARYSRSGAISFLRERRVLSVQCLHQGSPQAAAEMALIMENLCSESGRIICIQGIAGALGPTANEAFIGWLVGALERAHSSVIAVLTPVEHEELLQSRPALAAMFTVVNLPEPEVATATRMLEIFAHGLQREYELKVESGALKAVVSLSHNYVLNDRLPGKAIRILRDICESKRFDRDQLSSQVGTVTGADVASKVSEMTGIPDHTLAGLTDGTDYRSAIMEPIVGQQEAVEEVAVELGLIKAGLAESGKPASVMLFVGQTGTGKTEMAKALARLYSTSKRLKTFTLGNFIESHSVSGIIGVPAGYVGHDKGGRLVNELLADPYGVFLLDEADKAHPDVLQPFLNLFDEGWISDQRGQKAHADRAIFILTTNVAQRQIGDMFRAGKSMDEVTAQVKELLSQIRHSKSSRPVFSPEFLARIGRIVVFKPLDRSAMEGICRRLIARMQEEWRSKRGKDLQVAETIIGQIADDAFNLNEKSKGKEGGRAVRRLLNDRLSASILREISKHQDEYRCCTTVHVRTKPAAPDPINDTADKVTGDRQYLVSFDSGDASQAAEALVFDYTT